MALHKPTTTVYEARRLSSGRADSSEDAPVVRPAMLPAATLPTPSPAPLPAPSPAPLPAPSPAPVVLTPAPPVTIEKPVRVKAPAPILASVPQPAPLVEGPRVQVFLSAKLPAAGVSVNFDALSNRYPPAKALQMILRKALDDYEVSLSDGTFAAAPQTYPTGGESIVQTSRIMAQTLLDKARSHFDPLGFESTRAFGLNLATAALALFFKNEAKRRAR